MLTLADVVNSGIVQVDTDILLKYKEHKILIHAGYVQVYIAHKYYYLHRIAMPGFPELDHKDRNPSNCLRENLRPATRQEQGANQKIRKNNKSGYKGVSWDAERNKWVARMKIYGVYSVIGRFDTPEQANIAYQTTSSAMYGEFATEGKI